MRRPHVPLGTAFPVLESGRSVIRELPGSPNNPMGPEDDTATTCRQQDLPTGRRPPLELSEIKPKAAYGARFAMRLVEGSRSYILRRQRNLFWKLSDPRRKTNEKYCYHLRLCFLRRADTRRA